MIARDNVLVMMQIHNDGDDDAMLVMMQIHNDGNEHLENVGCNDDDDTGGGDDDDGDDAIDEYDAVADGGEDDEGTKGQRSPTFVIY